MRGYRHEANTLTSQTGPARDEAVTRAVRRPTRLCTLALGYAAEETMQDRGTHHGGARWGAARLAVYSRHDGRGTYRVCRRGHARTGQAGVRAVASAPQDMGVALRSGRGAPLRSPDRRGGESIYI